MADVTSKTIDQLPEKTELTENDMIPVDDGEQTYKVLWSTVLNKVKAFINPDKYLEKTGDTTNNTVTFTSGDNTNPTGWDDINIVTSGETHASLLRKFSLAVKNLRFLYKMLGSTDISSIGDGTITGAISTQNSNLLDKLKYQKISSLLKANSSFSFDINFEQQCYLSLAGTNYTIRGIYMITKNYDGQTVIDTIFQNNSWHDINLNGNTVTVNNISAYDLAFYFTVIYV